MITKSQKEIKRVLVIDDDPVILKSIERQLRELDIELELINKPLDALKYVFDNDYDLVLCDIKMEPVDGMYILKKIKDYRPGLPVIIITGYVNEELEKRAHSIGCSDFLVKPVMKDVLINAIKNLKIRY